MLQKDAYCGLYCEACPVYIATQNNTLNSLSQKIDLPVQEIACHGCKSDTNFQWCRICNLKKCAREKNIEFCIECSDYPCQDLTNFKEETKYPYHCEVFDNLEEIKNLGKEKWLKNQQKRWSCQNCGSLFSYYDLKCPECSQEVNGYKKPE